MFKMTRLGLKIIEFLADYPEKEFYSEEISRNVKCNKATASLLLRSLSKSGLIFRQVRGHMKFYRVNPKNAELKAIKINSAVSKLKPILSKLAKYSDKIILFGSVSRGEQTRDSDIDLLILSRNKNKIREILMRSKTDRPIKAIIKTVPEWSETEIKEPEFYREIKSGIILR